MADVLLGEVSPYGTMQTVVEADGRTVYVYLAPVDSAHEVGMRAVWVGNEIDVRGTRYDPGEQAARGLAPVVDAAGCAQPEGRPRPRTDDLSVVWWPAGDGVFVLERGRLIAAVPPWADSTCPGYSLAAADQTPVAWPLAGTELTATLAEAQAFWQPDRLEFGPLQRAVLDALEAAVGPSVRYWQIDGGRWPLCGASLHKPLGAAGPSLVATAGMSLVPMPSRGLDIDPIEIAVVAEGDDEGCARLLSTFAHFPWEGLTWLGPGHTVTCDRARPSTWPKTSALLVPAGRLGPLAGLDRIALPGGRSARLLVLVPTTPDERLTAIEEGAGALLARLPADDPWWFARR